MNSQIDESEVIISKIAIMVIQPIIGKQIRCGVEGLNCRVVGDPTSEMPVPDVQQRLIFLGGITFSAQPSLNNLPECGVPGARVRGRSATVGNRYCLCAVCVGKVIPIDFALVIPKLKRRP